MQAYAIKIKIIITMTTQRLQLKARQSSSKFRELIDSLRAKTTLKEQIYHSKQPLQSQQSLPVHPVDILPVTQMGKVDIEHVLKGEEGVELSEIEESISESEQDSMIETDKDRMLVNQITDLLKPEEKLVFPINEGRLGSIRRQRLTLNKPYFIKQPNYIKLPINQHQQNSENFRIDYKTCLNDVDEIQMIKYWNHSAKIDENTSIQRISEIFQELIKALKIKIPNPTVKKYKNCVYLGPTQSFGTYEGIIYYFDSKIYYGELNKGVKNGFGKEIDFARAIRYAGYFQQGKKNGFFFVQKQRENYEGLLLHGLYQGKGKLTAEDSIYSGIFENGKKHGFGQQYYPKTGLILKGLFKNGQFQHLDQSKVTPDPTSEPQLKFKPQKVISKSNSYDIDFQLPKTFKKQVWSMTRNYQSPYSRQDSKSLFDIAANTSKTNKYDFHIDELRSKLPKIRIQGIKTKLKQLNPETDQEDGHFEKQLGLPHRRYHSQQQKSFTSSNANSDLQEPLNRHRLNSPIHKLK